MKSALLLLAFVAVSAASPEDIYKKFLRSMDVYNFRMKCWGEKNVVKLSKNPATGTSSLPQPSAPAIDEPDLTRQASDPGAKAYMRQVSK